MKILVLLLTVLFTRGIYAGDNGLTHYTTENLRVRSGSNLSSATVTVLPQFTALRITETGAEALIDGVRAPWVKIVSQTGYAGWCFSGYIKEIEENVAEEIAAVFAGQEAGQFSETWIPVGKFFVPLVKIKAATGYYIQQHKRFFQGQGRAPEILMLTVENEKVCLREIDVVDKKRVVLKEIELEQWTYSSKNVYMRLHEENIGIVYKENMPEGSYYGGSEYDRVYTFAGNLNFMPDSVRRMTTDYLRTFTGTYVYDSHKILIERGTDVDWDWDWVRRATIEIEYVQEYKSLGAHIYELRGFYEKKDNVKDRHELFIETLSDEPFSWTYGEGAGYIEEKFYFYKGGIAFTYDFGGVRFDAEDNPISGRLKYVVFFKKQ